MVMTKSLPIHPAVPFLQVVIAILGEELDALAVAPLPAGRAGLSAAEQLACAGEDIAALARACEVLTRRAKEFADS